MSEHEWVAFLGEGTRTGKLAYVLPSGRATVSPIWFVYEDGVIRTQTDVSSPKAEAIRADPRVTLLVDSEEPPYAFVRVSATARILTDRGLLRRVATATGGRYMGQARASEYGARNSGPEEVTLELTPTKVTALAGVSD